ncbi:hypothetical protein BSKO_05094 [Bryopsis sp. KO-2023]|nr:hypothetical protein BSKO_05094 [Bryopsis sp. KO-2023]
MSDGEDLRNSKYQLLNEFSTLLFAAESAKTQSEALALASFVTSRRLAENSSCSDNAHFDALRTAHDLDGAARDDLVADVLRTAKVPQDFEFDLNDANHDLHQDFRGESHHMAALAELRHSIEEVNLSSLLGQHLMDHTNGEKIAVTRQGGMTAQAIDLTLSESPGRPVRKRRLQHPISSKVSQPYDARPAQQPGKNQIRQNRREDRMEVEDFDDENDRARREAQPDPLRSVGFQTAGERLRADAQKKHGKGKGNPFPAAPGNGRGPRLGLSKRGTNGDSLRGGFVPPFVKKAMDGPSEKDQESPFSPKTLELLGGPDGELPEEIQKLDPNLVETICSEVMDVGGAVEWDDIAGQEAAKQLVQELVVWPMLNPHLFKGARAPPRGLLLFGPPGTGKTLIGKAIASNIQATFFSISASSLTSKWIGEGEKLVRTLFAVSACIQPAVIFIDEIDSILSARKSEGEHEASRRLKTELLVQMEGCSTNSADRRVLLVGATNRPEELDEAARRRMPKQLYIPLPCGEARKQMILRQLKGVKASLSDVEVTKVVQKTSGYSGSDMKNLVQEACQGPVRDAMQSMRAGISNILEADLRPVKIKDFQVAARAQKPSVGPDEVFRHESYNEKHGAKYVVQEDEELEDDW